MNAGKKAIKSVPEVKKASRPSTAKKEASPVASKASTPKASKPVSKVAEKTAAAPQKASSPVAKTASKVAPKTVAKVAPQAVAKTAGKGAPKATPKAAAKPVATKAPSKAAKPSAVTPEPHSYSPEYLVVMQKDPNWMHAFWDVSERRVQNAVQGGSKLVLRLYDVSKDITVRTQKSRKFRDIEVPSDARSWYIQNQGEGGALHVALGTVTSSGGFEPIVNSDHVQSFGPEGQYLGAPDDMFLRASLGGGSVSGFGSSGQILPGVSSASFLFAPSSESFSSMAYSSNAFSSAAMLQNAPSDMVRHDKDFFLWVKTRLIVYGGTRPDAHLQVRGQPFPLNPDGTFSLEMDLPDSTQIIPVFATDHEGDFPTTIVPVVVKRTE